MLNGLRVLDLSELFPGPLATQLLADLGAEVMKVERPTGDPMRHAEPAAGESSAQFRALNRGKRSIAIDLRSERGSALARQLASSVDVVVESYRPGVADRLQVGYDAMRVGHQSLVYVSLSGFGPLSPQPGAAAHDINAIALSGLAAAGADSSGSPQLLPALVADTTLATLTSTAILAAVHRAAATDQGCHLQLSLMDSALWVAGMHRAAAAGGADVTRGAHLTTGGHAGYGYYACADGKWVAVGALEPHLWQSLVNALDVPDAVDEPSKGHAVIAAAFARESREHWLHLLEPLDTCVTPVLDHQEVLAGKAGTAVDETIPTPFVVDGARPVSDIAVPDQLGRDTVGVLRDAGVSEQEIADAVAAGAIAADVAYQ